ncbi:unnamed protein product, partial [Bubo scandiacus]
WAPGGLAQRQGLQSCEAEGPDKPRGTGPQRRQPGMLRRGDISPQPPPANLLLSLRPEHPPTPEGSGGGWQRGPERGAGLRGRRDP